jgi:hypothetical protein
MHGMTAMTLFYSDELCKKRDADLSNWHLALSFCETFVRIRIRQCYHSFFSFTAYRALHDQAERQLYMYLVTNGFYHGFFETVA